MARLTLSHSLPPASPHVHTVLFGGGIGTNGGVQYTDPTAHLLGLWRKLPELHLQASRLGSLRPKGRLQGATVGKRGCRVLSKSRPPSRPAGRLVQPAETRLKIHIQGSCSWEERPPKGGSCGDGLAVWGLRLGVLIACVWWRPASYGHNCCPACTQWKGERGDTAFGHHQPF